MGLSVTAIPLASPEDDKADECQADHRPDGQQNVHYVRLSTWPFMRLRRPLAFDPGIGLPLLDLMPMAFNLLRYETDFAATSPFVFAPWQGLQRS